MVDLVKFRGAKIPTYQSNILQEIERIIGKEFYHIEDYECSLHENGFFTEENKITGICLVQNKLETIPDGIFKLKYKGIRYLGICEIRV